MQTNAADTKSAFLCQSQSTAGGSEQTVLLWDNSTPIIVGNGANWIFFFLLKESK